MNRVYYTVGNNPTKIYSYQQAINLGVVRREPVQTKFEYVSTDKTTENWRQNHLTKILERCF